MNDCDKNLKMARSVAQVVRVAGGRAYYVGGYVRDKLLNKENKDIDLEIHGIEEEALCAVLQGLGEPISVGGSFGIYGLRHYDLDISLPRSERERQIIDPHIGTKAAAMRRDLTINALMQDVLTGEIIDHFGGREDLERGIIRHVDEKTFAEDPLRVLRTAQFAARFGFAVAEETMALCRTLSLAALPRERVWGEIEKVLLKAPRPSVFFVLLRQMGQLEDWLPEVRMLTGIGQNARYHPEGDVWNHTMMVLDAAAGLRGKAQYPLGLMVAALCHDFGKITATEQIDGVLHAYGHEEQGVAITETFLCRLTAEEKLRRYVLSMVRLHMEPNKMVRQNSGMKSFCKMFDKAGSAEDLLLLAKADHLGKLGAEPYDETEQKLREILSEFHRRMAQPYVMGADLIEAGFAPGGDFGQALEYAHKLRLAGIEKESALRQTAAFLRKLRTK